MSNQETNTDCERMSNAFENKNIDLDSYRKLVKHYIDLVQTFHKFCFSFITQIEYKNTPIIVSNYSICTVQPYSGQIKFFH